MHQIYITRYHHSRINPESKHRSPPLVCPTASRRACRFLHRGRGGQAVAAGAPPRPRWTTAEGCQWRTCRPWPSRPCRQQTWPNSTSTSGSWGRARTARWTWWRTKPRVRIQHLQLLSYHLLIKCKYTKQDYLYPLIADQHVSMMNFQKHNRVFNEFLMSSIKKEKQGYNAVSVWKQYN